MRSEKASHIPLFCQYSNTDFSGKLKLISRIIDENEEVLKWVHEDIVEKGTDSRGAKGMTAENVLRAAILKQIHQWTYEELAYHLKDSSDARAFVRCDQLGFAKSTLQNSIVKITSSTWEAINVGVILPYACKIGLEKGSKVRIDSTVVPTNIHLPTDSKLIVDCMKELKRVKGQAKKEGISCPCFKLSLKKAKKTQFAISNSRKYDQKVPLYEELLVKAEDTRLQIQNWILRLPNTTTITQRLQELEVVFEQIICQGVTRVLNNEGFPSNEKIVSIYETHTDVIVKSFREVEYGHKVFFTTGKSNLVLDCNIPRGNPSDSIMFSEMLERVKENCHRAPKQVAADGGFASQDNIEIAKENGVRDISFPKRVRAQITDMARSKSIFQRLLNFRAGVESNISCLKRAYGLNKALWKGLAGYCSYVWANVVAYNLMILAK